MSETCQQLVALYAKGGASSDPSGGDRLFDCMLQLADERMIAHQTATWSGWLEYYLTIKPILGYPISGWLVMAAILSVPAALLYANRKDIRSAVLSAAHSAHRLALLWRVRRAAAPSLRVAAADRALEGLRAVDPAAHRRLLEDLSRASGSPLRDP